MTKFLARTLCIFTLCLSASVLFAQGRPLRQAPGELPRRSRQRAPKCRAGSFLFPIWKNC